MHVLITGASGFIGYRTAERLLESGYEVRTCGRRPEPPRSLAALPAPYMGLDYLDPAQCAHACHGIDAIVHCAGQGGTWASWERFHTANVRTTEALLAAAQDTGVKRFINLSSASIQFDYRHQLDLPETFLPSRFSNAYAETKYRAECAVSAAHGPSLLTLSLRPRGVVGAGDAIWLPTFIDLRKRNALKQAGDGRNLANFTSAANLVDAIELSLTAPADVLGGVYNIHNGRPERLWDVVERGLRACGLDADRGRIPLSVAMPVARLSEAWHRFRKTREEPALLPIKVGVSAYSFTVDISSARERLGYSPRQSTDDALAEFAAWHAGTTQ